MLKGDPAKAMEGVADVVRGEGKAAEKCDQTLHLLEDWKEVSTGLDIDPEDE
ncbi:hypothetical protein C8R44DRAFT_866305 [Mycena epipterygia]|nr:hypothetical protein C8R44DRAFT_866305 [Mycena epipterygia]